MRSLLVCVLGVCVLSACYDPSIRRCVATCASSSECPSGQTCDNGFCARAGESCALDAGVDADTDAPIVGGWAELSTGLVHACAITTAHTLWCWGNNDQLQLGVAEPPRSGVPLRVDVLGNATNDWEHVAAGPRHTCATRQDGTLWCWGRNDNLQCGAATGIRIAPTRVNNPSGLTGTRWTAVATGSVFTCALRDDGSLWCFGTGYEGELGQNTASSVSAVPLRVGTSTDWRSIDAGERHICGVHGAVSARGQIACWGDDAGEGRIGDGMNTSRYAPTPVMDDGSIDWQRVTVGEYAACALDATGAVWCWGDRYHVPGQQQAAAPMRYGTSAGFDRVSMGTFGGCLVDDGAVSCWGSNGESALGTTPGGVWPDPLVVAGVSGVAEIGAGEQFVCTLDGGGAIACWGDGGDGQLGDNEIGNPRAPVEVLGQHHPWLRVDAGDEHACAVTMAGAVYCWGSNWSGQVGGGASITENFYASPIAVALTGTYERVETGYAHACALSSTGLLSCWGNNDYGQRGVTAPSNYTPTQVDTVALGQLATALHANCGITAGGARRCWGANDVAQVGNGGTSASVATPTTITESVAGWTRVSMGDLYGCGIATGGLYCWGYNDAGQTAQTVTGSSTVSATLVPDPTPATDTWIDVGAGAGHACAVLSANGTSGDIYCWGYNGQGQLGSGRLSGPMLSFISGAANWIAVAGGYSHTCGLRATGELHCWGSNEAGELGDGTPLPHDGIGPSIGGMTDWVAVDAGMHFTCGIRGTDRRLYCWGEGRYGQTGIGTSVHAAPSTVSRPE